MTRAEFAGGLTQEEGAAGERQLVTVETVQPLTTGEIRRTSTFEARM